MAELLDAGEALCAPCAVKRLSASTAAAATMPWGWVGEQATLQPAAGAMSSLLMMTGDAVGTILRGGQESKEGATLRSALHSEVPAQLIKARSKWRDAIDMPLLGGPCRNAAVAEAIASYSMGSARSILADSEAEILSLVGDEVLATMPVSSVLGAARKLRESWRESFVTMPTFNGVARRTIHMGRAATCSCVIVVATLRDAMPTLVRRASRILQGTMKETFGGNALVVLVRPDQGRELVFGARWDEAVESLDAVVELLRGLKEPARLIASVSALGVALTNVDLDKSKNEARIGLIRSCLLREAPEVVDAERMARALLTLIDRNVVAMSEADGQHGMDGIHVAGFLAEGVR
jgi:hypothetical protein